MMTNESFMQELLMKLHESKNDQYEFQLLEVTKRNDTHRTSLCVRQKGDALGINLYVDQLMQSFKKLNYNYEALVDYVLDHVQKYLLNGEFSKIAVEQVANIQNYESVKNNIAYRLVSIEANHDYLKNVAYTPFLNLAICYYISISSTDEVGTINVTNDMLDWWNVSVDELYQDALINTPKLLPYCFESLNDLLSSYFDNQPFSKQMNPPIFKDDLGLFVITNKSKSFGAASVLYPNAMKEISEKLNSDEIVVIFSSVHECILLPLTKDIDISAIHHMVCEINATTVPHEDKLSDDVYKYSRTIDEISILTGQ